MTEDVRRPAGEQLNAPAMLAKLSGLSEAEIRWTFDRMKQLMIVEGLPKDQAKRIVAQEALTRPWER